MKFLKQPFAPITPPEAALARVLYDAGQWCCDNLAVFMGGVSACSLILRSLSYGI